jgi:hypothetical protein
MRFRLRTLMIVLALGPPMLAGTWVGVQRYRAWREVESWTAVGGPGPITIFEFQISCRFDADSRGESLDDPD